MHSAASEEQWVALRALRERQRPTYLRLSRASGINISTIAKRAQSHNWRSPDERPDRAGDADDLPMAERGPDGQSGYGQAVAPGAAGLEADGLHADPGAQIAEMLKRQAARMLAAAEAQGRILDKAQIDTMWSIIRLVERQKTLASERAEEKNTGEYEGLGDVHRRIDRRILELAISAARWMVATGDPRPLQ